MAVYTAFFLCRPEDLPAGFPGWQPPLAKPVSRKFRNPFTGQESVIETREPEWPEPVDDEPGHVYQVVEIDGNYEDYLENRLPAFVRSCPHWATKGLTCVELAPLIQEIGAVGAIEGALFSPPSCGSVVEQFPAEFLPKLGSQDLKAVAIAWAAAMSLPEHTHSVTGVKLTDGWQASEAESLLGPLMALARRATADQQLYLLTEA